jgi:hypothetical protein
MTPLSYRWSGDSFQITPRHAKAADEQFVIGQAYCLEVVEERSSKSHAHFFAAVNAAWLSLPEGIADQWPTSTHLRKWCLIKAGFHNHRSIVAKSRAEALRLAAFIKPMDDYAVVVTTDCVINVYTAKSQKHRAMNKQEFAASKEAVLAILADLIAVNPAALERAETA